MSKHLSILLALFLMMSSLTWSQSSREMENSLTAKEDAIVKIIDGMREADTPEKRDALNLQLLEQIYDALDSEEGLKYPFDKLHSISDLKNESFDFRVMTWELEDKNGKILYFGVLSYLYDKQIFTHYLRDSSSAITNAQYRKLRPDTWYGALYYDIREYNHKKERQIVLLGINRNETLLKKRLVEVVEISEKLRFGAEVFEIKEEDKFKRLIYEHSIEAEMSIWFDDEDERILMDHLSPLQPMFKGKYEYYVPDLSFDALNFNKGSWKYEADVDARMEKNLKDRFFEMELQDQEKVY